MSEEHKETSKEVVSEALREAAKEAIVAKTAVKEAESASALQAIVVRLDRICTTLHGEDENSGLNRAVWTLVEQEKVREKAEARREKFLWIVGGAIIVAVVAALLKLIAKVMG